jgi:outer membrane protein assembly factor BamB
MRLAAIGVVAVLLVSAVCAAFGAAPAAGEWPCWRGPNHDDKSPDKGLLKEWPPEGPPLLWKVDGIGRGFSSVSVSGGKVYVTGDTGGRLAVFAFDMTGKPLGKIDHDQAWTGDPGGARATPTIDSGKLYILSGHGLLGCYEAATGRKVWTRAMKEFAGGVPGWGYSESVLILGNLAIATPGGKNCIVALDKATGRTVWMSRGYEAPANYGSCVPFTFQGVPQIAAGTGGGIVGVDARTGEALWSNGFAAGNTANCPTPAYSDGLVFWANGYGKGGICMRLSVAGGRASADEAWTTPDMDCHHGGYIIDNGYIYGNAGGGWACLELKSGNRKWYAEGVGKGSLTWADGMLYLFGENNGRAALATCSPQGLKIKGDFKVKGSGPSWAHPVVIGGRLYLRYDANLYCFDVKAK